MSSSSSSKLCFSRRLTYITLFLFLLGISIVAFSSLSSSVNKTTSSKADGPAADLTVSEQLNNDKAQLPANCVEKNILTCVANGYYEKIPKQQFNDQLGINKRFPMVSYRDCSYTCPELNERAGQDLSYVYDYSCYNDKSQQFECYLARSDTVPNYTYTPPAILLSAKDTVAVPFDHLDYCSSDNSQIIMSGLGKISSFGFSVASQDGPLDYIQDGVSAKMASCIDFAKNGRIGLYAESEVGTVSGFDSVDFVFSCLDTSRSSFGKNKTNLIMRTCYYKAKPPPSIPLPWPTISNTCKDLSQDKCLGNCAWYGCNKCAERGADKNIVCGDNGATCLSIKDQKRCESSSYCQYNRYCEPGVCSNKGMDDYFACSPQYRKSQPINDPNQSCASLGPKGASLQPLNPNFSWIAVSDPEIARLRCQKEYPEYTVCRSVIQTSNGSKSVYMCGKAAN